MNLDRWLDLMSQLNLPPSEETYHKLLAVHSGPDRHYHNVAHVTHCLDLVDQYRTEIPDADLVELAFWFHDAVYDAQSKTNEEDSANWAARFLNEQGATEDVGQAVYDLIMATRHTAADLSPTAEWMVDIDLSILGADSATFERYEQNIRLEYAWVPQEEFTQRRADLLEGFLTREWIFNTAIFRANYEQAARANLRRSVAQLKESI